MPESGTPERPLICPGCFAKDIDPVMLELDPDTAEYYCPRCIYVAQSAEQVRAFYDEIVFRRYGIRRKESISR